MTGRRPHVLVTGSDGFVGRALIRRLRRDGYPLTEFDLARGSDITRWEQVRHTEPFDVAVHLAARTFVPDSFRAPHEFFRTNVTGTLNLLELARRRGARVVYASAYVYGRPRYLPIDEAHPVQALNPYTASKLLGEDLCRSYHRDSGVPVVILRAFNVYGPGQRPEFLIPRIVQALPDGEVRLADPAPRRDWLYLDDAVAAYAKAVEFDAEPWAVFNVGAGRSHSVREVTDMVRRQWGRPFNVQYEGRRREGEIDDLVADCRRIGAALGWRPAVDLAEGIRRMLAETFGGNPASGG
jgi:UDP-glucose 4-epimerase